MNKLLLPLVAMIPFMVSAQSNSDVFPYNPDFDGNGDIGSADLIGFLPVYGSPFIVDGVLPVEGGGTGVGTIEEARQVLSITVFEDLIAAGDSGASGVVHGGLTVESWINIVGDISNDGSLDVGGTFESGFGSNASGSYAHASGRNCTASGPYSKATNQNTSAQGICSVAEGEGTTAVSTAAHSEGMLTVASGTAAHAEGFQSTTSANYTHAEGYGSSANAIASHAEGWGGTADGLYSHAEGRNSTSMGDASHAEGYQSISEGYASHAEGYQTLAQGSYSHTGGRSSVATGNASTAIGYNIVADQDYSTVVGQYNMLDQVGTLFVVGAGTGDTDRINAFEVSSDGAKVQGELILNGESVIALIDSLQAQIQLLQQQVEALGGQ